MTPCARRRMNDAYARLDARIQRRAAAIRIAMPAMSTRAAAAEIDRLDAWSAKYLLRLQRVHTAALDRRGPPGGGRARFVRALARAAAWTPWGR